MEYSSNNQDCCIVLYNAQTKEEAKRIRRDLLENKLIRGGFIVQIEPAYLNEQGSIEENDAYFAVFCHTVKSFEKDVLIRIGNISESFGMSWDIKQGTNNYVDWVNEISRY